MLVHEVFQPQVMSCSVERTLSEEKEALDDLVPLSKRQTRRMSFYQISKLSLSLDVGDITEDLRERWSLDVPAQSVEALRSYLRQPLKQEEKIPISQETFDSLCVPYSL